MYLSKVISPICGGNSFILLYEISNIIRDFEKVHIRGSRLIQARLVRSNLPIYYIYTYIHIYVYIYIYMHVSIYGYTYAYMYMYIHMYSNCVYTSQIILTHAIRYDQ
jgi:hypothetical protein